MLQCVLQSTLCSLLSVGMRARRRRTVAKARMRVAVHVACRVVM